MKDSSCFMQLAPPPYSSDPQTDAQQLSTVTNLETVKSSEKVMKHLPKILLIWLILNEWASANWVTKNVTEYHISFYTPIMSSTYSNSIIYEDIILNPVH